MFSCSVLESKKKNVYPKISNSIEPALTEITGIFDQNVKSITQIL